MAGRQGPVLVSKSCGVQEHADLAKQHIPALLGQSVALLVMWWRKLKLNALSEEDIGKSTAAVDVVVGMQFGARSNSNAHHRRFLHEPLPVR